MIIELKQGRWLVNDKQFLEATKEEQILLNSFFRTYKEKHANIFDNVRFIVEYSLKVKNLNETTREREIVEARVIFANIMFKIFRKRVIDIARFLENLYYLRVVDDWTANKSFATKIKKVENQVKVNFNQF